MRAPIDKVFRILSVCLVISRLNPDLNVDFYASARLVLLYFIKKIKKIPYIFFVGADVDVDGGYAKLTNPLFYRLYVWGLKKADKIICQTNTQVEMLKNTYGLQGVLVLSPYIDIVDPILEKKEFILWIGRSTSYKRPEHFITLAEKIPDEKFLMICNIGDRDYNHWNLIKKRAESLANLIFIEAVPHDTIRNFYSRAKLLVNTSDFEGFSNSFVEAALEEVPILSLNVDSNGVLTKHGGGVFCEGNIDKMVSVCRLMAKNEDTLIQMGKQARAYAIKYHDIKWALKKIDTNFLEIVKKGL
jgi:glycosyltransferase involved in cell wall biosynthesis